MTTLWQVALMLVAFFAVLLGFTYVIGKKFSSLLKLLREGSRLELTSRTGWYSLAVVVLVASVALAVIVGSELRDTLFPILKIPLKDDEGYPAIALFSLVITGVADFLVIASNKRNDMQE